MTKFAHIKTFSVDWHWGKDQPPAEVELVAGEYIRIKGLGTTHRGQLPDGTWVNYRPKFDRTFKVGDIVEYGSYNLRYTGKIMSIGEKRVLVDCSGTGERKKSMTHRDFIFRNWDLDLEAIAKENATTMQYI